MSPRRHTFAAMVTVIATAALSLTVSSGSARADASPSVTVVAGIGTDQSAISNDIPATSAALWSPQGVAVAPGGDLIIADTSHNQIRRVDASGIIHAVLGDGNPGCNADGSSLVHPRGVAVDSSGDIFVADSDCGLVLELMTNGSAMTVAGHFDGGGNGTPTIEPGELATSATLYGPTGLWYNNATQTLYIADSGSNRVLGVNSGFITVVAGDGTPGFDGDGGNSLSAQLSGPNAVLMHGDSLYVSDAGNSRIRKIDAAGIISTIAGPDISAPTGLAFDSLGELLVAGGSSGLVYKLDTTGALSTLVSLPGGIGGLAVDAHDNLFVAQDAISDVYEVSGFVAAPVPTPTPTPTPPPIKSPNTVVLGDSYGAGEGVPPFEAGTDVSSPKAKRNMCHRSTRSYAHILESASKIQLQAFAACSGATTFDLLNTKQYANQPPQIQVITPSTERVVVSVGGNDIHFSELATDCVIIGCVANIDRSNDDVIVLSKILLPKLYQAIAKRVSPGTPVYIMGYPQVVPDPNQVDITSCAAIRLKPAERITPAEVRLLRTLTTRLDTAIKAVALQYGFSYVDPAPAFSGHELCTSAPFFNGVSAKNSEFSFHPNALGQTAFANALEAQADF